MADGAAPTCAVSSAPAGPTASTIGVDPPPVAAVAAPSATADGVTATAVSLAASHRATAPSTYRWGVAISSTDLGWPPVASAA